MKQKSLFQKAGVTPTRASISQANFYVNEMEPEALHFGLEGSEARICAPCVRRMASLPPTQFLFLS